MSDDQTSFESWGNATLDWASYTSESDTIGSLQAVPNINMKLRLPAALFLPCGMLVQGP